VHNFVILYFSNENEVLLCEKKLPPSLNQRLGWNSYTRRFYATQEGIALRDDVQECFQNSDISKQILEPYEGTLERWGGYFGSFFKAPKPPSQHPCTPWRDWVGVFGAFLRLVYLVYGFYAVTTF